MSDGQAWAAEMIESTGEKLTAEQRIEAAIRYCKERIEHYQEVLKALEAKP